MSLVIPLEKEGCQKRNGPSLGPFFVGGVAGAGDGQLPGPKRVFLHRIKVVKYDAGKRGISASSYCFWGGPSWCWAWPLGSFVASTLRK